MAERMLSDGVKYCHQVLYLMHTHRYIFLYQMMLHCTVFFRNNLDRYHLTTCDVTTRATQLLVTDSVTNSVMDDALSPISSWMIHCH